MSNTSDLQAINTWCGCIDLWFNKIFDKMTEHQSYINIDNKNHVTYVYQGLKTSLI